MAFHINQFASDEEYKTFIEAHPELYPQLVLNSSTGTVFTRKDASEEPIPTTTYAVLVYQDPTQPPASVIGGGEYAAGDTVTLSCTASESGEFDHWEVPELGYITDNPYVFTMPEHDIEITCVTTSKKYTVSLSTNPEGIGTLHGAGTYSAGDTVTINVTDYGANMFVQWNHPSEVVLEYEFVPSTSFVMPATNVSLEGEFLMD